MESVISPENRGSFTAESYKGQNDHPEFMSYLQGEHGDGVGVMTGQVMERWVDVPIISEGFQSCYAVIAINGGKAQMIHMSRDPWRSTNTDEYWKKLKEWQKDGCDVAMVRAERSAWSGGEIEEIRRMFGDKFLDLNLKVDSRFGLVVDTKQRLLLVQLTDAKEFRKYHI